MNSPSINLLSAIFKKEVTYVMMMPEDCDTHNSEKIIFQFKNVVYGGISGIEDEQINIYEFANKCKEWAFEFNYNLCSSKRKNGGWECWTVFDDNADNLIGYFETLSEPESIFKACQWILDNKDKK